MKENTNGRPAEQQPARPKRSPKRRQPEAPDFLVRLTGKARARSLSKEVIIHHRHD